jgi:outer membrane protein assembly factor BamB
MSAATKEKNEFSRVSYQSAVGTAIVAAVFSVFIAVLLAVNAYHMTTTDPQRSIRLETMKEQAKQYPADEVLAEEIAQLDTDIRRDQFARLYFSQRGTMLLVVTLVLLTGSVIWAKSHRPGLPQPAPQGDPKSRQVRHASHTRLAFSIGLIVLCAGALFWVMHAPPMPSERDGQPQTPAAPLYASMEQAQTQWSTFRGPGGLGLADFENIPDTWDGPSGQNILWKSPIPLPGHNSPVIWEDRIFLTGATETAQQVYCYDTQTGSLLWTGDVSIPANPARDDMQIMEDTGYAACTAVTDGLRVCAIFAGGDMGCFTADGKPLWEKHLGIPDSMYGYAASLTWFENLVIVQWDVGYEGQDSKLIALDWQTGKTVWQTPRPVPNSWSSPTVVSIDGQYRIVTTASPFVIVYDAKTGTELYRVDCMYGDIASTPILAGKNIIAIEPYNKLVAVNADESQSVEDPQTRIAWETSTDMPDICSPVSDHRYIWTLTTPGALGCFDVTDGSEMYTQPLKLPFQASPTVVGQTLYLLTEKGTMVLADTGAEFSERKRNELGEKCRATPAFQEGRIYIRSEDNLYAIGSS